MSRPTREQELVQQALPAYVITGELGRGAFGVVYAARHTQLGRDVAIKQLPRAFAIDPTVRERFVAEARMVASLDHPHIVPVYDFLDRDDGMCLLIMERCTGSVADRFHADGLATDDACAAVVSCCAALDFAHGAGVLHRDVKPENLLYDARGAVKLGDFGVARALVSDARRTATGMVIGTPAYMSPEQVRGERLTPASDVYSAGVMAYELLTGSLPFPGASTTTGLLAHHLVTAPTPLLVTRPELPGAIGSVVDRALSKSLAERQATPLELATELTRACVGAFGAGWIRRRRYVLHWAEIVAESERPQEGGVRTGTIVVRAHRPIEDDALAETPVPAGLLPPPAVASSSPPASPSPSLPRTATRRSRAAWIAAGVAAVVLAAGLGVWAISRDDDTAADADTTAVESDATVDSTDGTEVDATSPDSAAPATVVSTLPDTVDPATTVIGTPTSTSATETSTAFTLPIPVRPDLDVTLAESAFTPTPCPAEPERVACILGGVAVDPSTGELDVPFYTAGFVPELEPAGYHLHFYLDSAVDGDERKAGSEVPGGQWKPWDAPMPFSSFEGESGRTGFTLGDVEAASARNMCVLVADADQRAIPGTGNCAPIAWAFDPDTLTEQLGRLTGRFVGRCAIGATMIVPDGWSAVDLVETSVADAARLLRPGNVEATERLLGEFVDVGGVLWVDGPLVGDEIVTATVTRVSGEFTSADAPEVVRDELLRLGLTAGGTVETHVVAGREILVVTNNGGADGDVETIRYVIPDFGYALIVGFRAPDGAALRETSDAIAATVMGC